MNTNLLGAASQVEASKHSRNGFAVYAFKCASALEWLRSTLELLDKLGKADAFKENKLIWDPVATKPETGATDDAEVP